MRVYETRLNVQMNSVKYLKYVSMTLHILTNGIFGVSLYICKYILVSCFTCILFMFFENHKVRLLFV